MTAISTEVLDRLTQIGAQHRPHVELPGGGKGVFVPPGYKIETFHPDEPILTRIHQTVTFFDLASFLDYVEDFRTPTTRIFVMPGYLSQDRQTTVTAVLDYHEETAETDDDDGTHRLFGYPMHCAHVAVYKPRNSTEWLRWTGAAPMSQAAFAEFIEECRRDITEPSAAMLLDIVSKFKTSKKVEFNSVVHQSNGDVVVGYAEQTDAAGSVKMPSELKIGIPVFFRGARYEIGVFVRYVIRDQKLAFTLKLDRPDYVEQAAIDEIVSEVSKKFAMPVFCGTYR